MRQEMHFIKYLTLSLSTIRLKVLMETIVFPIFDSLQTDNSLSPECKIVFKCSLSVVRKRVEKFHVIKATSNYQNF